MQCRCFQTIHPGEFHVCPNLWGASSARHLKLNSDSVTLRTHIQLVWTIYRRNWDLSKKFPIIKWATVHSSLSCGRLTGAFTAWCSLPYVSAWLLTALSALLRPPSAPYSVAEQTRRIYCTTVFYSISLVCADVCMPSCLCAAGPGASAEELLQSCCAAGQRWFAENLQCNLMPLLTNDKHSVCR